MTQSQPDPAPKLQRLTRSQKAEATRARLFTAAIEVVGEIGYADCSVSRITAAAEVGQGTFYNYFDSRQDLLEELLPAISQTLLDHIRQKMTQVIDCPLARERARIDGFFEFLAEMPHLFKLLHEGEFHARKGFQRHIELQSTSYLGALRYEARRGNLRPEITGDLETVARMLMASRDYISGHYCVRDGAIVQPPRHVIDTYMDFTARGLFRDEVLRSSPRGPGAQIG